MNFGIESLLFFVSSLDVVFWRIIFHSEFAFSVLILLARNGRRLCRGDRMGDMDTGALLPSGFFFHYSDFGNEPGIPLFSDSGTSPISVTSIEVEFLRRYELRILPHYSCSAVRSQI